MLESNTLSLSVNTDSKLSSEQKLEGDKQKKKPK